MKALQFLTAIALASAFAACGTDPEGPGTADVTEDTTEDTTSDATIDAPEPDAPEPDTPEPDAPEPDAPEPDAPEPDAEPDVPEPDVPEPDTPTGCAGENPEGCIASGCDDGEECFTFYSVSSICVSSGCDCDEASGDWICDADCGGGICVPEPGTVACEEDADCVFGAQWCEDGVCVECSNDSFLCDIDCPFGLVERHGCFPCECNPGPVCDVPETGCYEDEDCNGDEVCSPSDTFECIPSECGCDPETGETWCTDDCAPGRCTEPVCEGDNPAGCVDTGCPGDERCITFPEGPCVSSSCFCDESTGTWGCTDDCGGGICVPPEGDTCSKDSDCTAGAQWCEDGECVDCDNSAVLCRIACPEGESLYTRNECTPCDCAPINECLTDDDCEGWQECEPGAECLDWCPPDDPTCCYGNWCRDLPD